ncbi:carbohydrate-binding protein [Streptomyces abyssomicinicus]|uniref:carbohydrate-binding protein n=1 Tax=Streptomyces abyssomicinicus TaxID=574929 RepID=UPI00124FA19F|nr:carbohydrate-binding protein [Streptomyces abyssomicinicus]
MTSGNNGASTPEDDDPFGYLYADGQANGAQPPSGGGYGYPNSVNRVRAVGERRYGAQQTAQQPAQAPGAYGTQAPGAYGSPNPHYQAPEAAMGSVGVPGGPGAPGSRRSQDGGGRGRGPNTKGLMIGAVAVVAAVVVGITIAVTGGDDDADKTAGTDPSPTATSMEKPTEAAGDGKDKKKDEFEPTKIDAASLGEFAGGAALASDVPGSRAEGGSYIAGLNTPGSSVTWTVNGVPKDGQYTLFTYYGVPGEDAKATLTVNGGQPAEVNLKNYAGAEKGDWAKGWTRTYNYIPLKQGTNTITLSCADGCNANVDQFGLVQGEVAKEPKEFS